MTTTNSAVISVIFKERILNMPDNLDDKEIMAYAKNIIKEIKAENKKVKKEANENTKKRVAKKPKKTIEVDEDGNEKPRKLNKYQQFLKDNQKRVKEENPELTNTERFSKLAEEWNEYKKTIKEDDHTDTEQEVNTDTDTEITVDTEENEAVVNEKKKRKNTKTKE
jgi:hypothetical protein